MKIELRKVIIHQKQDPVFTFWEYVGTLLNDGANLSFTEKDFKKNPEIESCIIHFKDEYKYQIQEAQNLKEARKVISRSIF